MVQTNNRIANDDCGGGGGDDDNDNITDDDDDMTHKHIQRSVSPFF
jgi:hypothetical protein